MRKRALLFLLSCCLVLSPGLSVAQETATDDPFVVGCTTPVNGMFFTNMWGNNSSDIDVRSMLHDYRPVSWTMQALFEPNPTVVQDITYATLPNGNRQYNVTLHPDLTYNDGTPITAADYVFSMMLSASPVATELGGNATAPLSVAGYEAYHSGASSIFSGLRLVDTYKYTVEISQEYLPFFYELSVLDYVPAPISIIAPGSEVADDGQGAYIRNASDANAPSTFTAQTLSKTLFDPETGYMHHPTVTSGPYRLTEYDPVAQTVSFAINPRYKGNHDGITPSIDNIKLVCLTPENLVPALVSGEVDLLNKCVEGSTIDAGLSLFTDGTVYSSSYPRLGFGFIAFACERAPMDSEAVRKAIAYSLDTEAFTSSYTTLNYGMPVYGFYGIGQWMVQMITTGSQRPAAESDAELAAWEGVTLDSLEKYAPNAAVAEHLLTSDGWVLNAQGGSYTKGQDAVRHKMVDGTLQGLTLKFARTQDSTAVNLLLDMLTPALAEIGIALEVTEMPFAEMLTHYYRQSDREYDMMYLGSNFVRVFDPYFFYNTGADFDGVWNTTGYHDETLEKLALQMRATEPGDLLGYCQAWLAFQEYWNEKLPMLPLYSNIYFDFFTPKLQNYRPNEHMNWPTAIVYASLDEAAP